MKNNIQNQKIESTRYMTVDEIERDLLNKNVNHKNQLHQFLNGSKNKFYILHNIVNE
jgi:hypothetical protein